MKLVTSIVLLVVALLPSIEAGRILSLAKENYDKLTSGKTVFIKQVKQLFGLFVSEASGF